MDHTCPRARFFHLGRSLTWGLPLGLPLTLLLALWGAKAGGDWAERGFHQHNSLFLFRADKGVWAQT